MSLLNGRDRHLVALSGAEDHDEFIGRTITELLEQRAVLMGRVIQLETEAIADKYRGGELDPREREVLHGELLTAWSQIAAGHGDPVKYAAMRAIGRGEDVES